MESKRQQKINKLIQKELSEVFHKECSNLVQGKLITVTIVRVSSDLGLVRIYLSIMPDKAGPALIEHLTEEVSSIRHAMGNRLRNQLRKIPDFRFYLDDTAQYASKMNQVFNELNIPKEKEDDSTED